METEKRKGEEELLMLDVNKKQKVTDTDTDRQVFHQEENPPGNSHSKTHPPKSNPNKENGAAGAVVEASSQIKLNDAGIDINSNGPSTESKLNDSSGSAETASESDINNENKVTETKCSAESELKRLNEVHQNGNSEFTPEIKPESEVNVNNGSADTPEPVTSPKPKAKAKAKLEPGDKSAGDHIASSSSSTQAKPASGTGSTGNDASKISPEEPESELVELEEDKSDTKSGTLIICGGTNWDLIGRRDLPKTSKGATGRNLWSPHRLGALSGVRVRYVASGPTSAHSVIVTEDGKALSWGRNEKGQLGQGDQERRDTPTEIDGIKDFNIVNVSCGRHHTLLLTECGTVFSCGENKHGQCGIGNQHPIVHSPNRIAFKGRHVTNVACGAEFSVILDSKGYLHTFGYPEYGQLGHNTDGRYIEKAKKVSYSCEVTPKRVVVYIEKHREGHVTPVDSVQIVSMACGINHTVAIDTRKRCYTWGFGGYGRLGHASPKDEYVPRLLKFFDGPNRGVTSAYAGSTFCVAINELGAFYLWGQTKRSGEANMYPKPVSDLTGWGIRDIACSNTSIVVAADETVIAWGPSPTHGELGFGEMRKSSTQPKEMKACDGMFVTQVACGMGHTMLVVRDRTDTEKERINKLPEYVI